MSYAFEQAIIFRAHHECTFLWTRHIGLSLGLSAVNGIANGMREAGQERELARNRAELEQAKMKEADMEARLRMLEYQQRMPAPQ